MTDCAHMRRTQYPHPSCMDCGERLDDPVRAILADARAALAQAKARNTHETRAQQHQAGQHQTRENH